MAKSAPAFASFNSGELSPLLAGRVAGEFLGTYLSGCRVLENFIPLVQGPALRRGGSRYVAGVKNHEQRSWLVPFVFSASQSYMLEFGDEYVRFYTERGQLLDGGAPYEIASPYAVADLTNEDGACALKYVQSGDVLYLTCPGYAPRKLERRGVTDWAFSLYAPENGPFKTINKNKSLTVSGRTYAGAITGAADNGSGLIRLTVASTVGLNNNEWVRVALVNGTTEANGRWRVTVINGTTVDLQGSSFANSFTSSPNAEIRVRGEAGNGIVLTASAALFEAGHVGSLFYLEEDDVTDVKPWEVGKPVNVTERRRSDGKTYEALTTGNTGTEKPVHGSGSRYDGSDDTSTGSVTEGVLWQFNSSGIGWVEITAVNSATEAVGVIREPVPYELTVQGSTDKWAHSAWSDVEGWPQDVAFFRERLVFAKGFRLYFTVAGDFENMAATDNGEILPDSGMVVPVLSDQINQISWLASGQNALLVGTEGAEYAVMPETTTEPFGPENVEVAPQTSHGSRAITPLHVGNALLLVQRSGRRLYQASYSLAREQYDAVDVTVRAEHITRSGAVAMAYQQDPHSIVWVAMANGTLAGVTMDSAQGVQAWHRHVLGGGGVVESVQCMPAPDNDRDDVWMIVRRSINGQTQRYVEYLNPEYGAGEDIAGAFYVDSGLSYSGSPATTISGLGHLEGETVQVLADGATHPDRVVSGGQISLQVAASVVQVGLACPATLQTMRMEAGAMDGSAQAKTKRIYEVTLRLQDTVGLRAGPSLAVMDEILFRDPSMSMSAPIPPFSGDKGVLWPAGYEKAGYLTVQQPYPLPATIVGMFPELVTN